MLFCVQTERLIHKRKSSEGKNIEQKGLSGHLDVKQLTNLIKKSKIKSYEYVGGSF